MLPLMKMGSAWHMRISRLAGERQGRTKSHLQNALRSSFRIKVQERALPHGLLEMISKMTIEMRFNEK